MKGAPIFTLSRHARERMEGRKIPKEWIEHVLRSPVRVATDPIDPELTHAYGVIPEMNNRVLRIVYNSTRAVPHIVTVHFQRRMKGQV